MTRTCTVCAHPDRAAIDKALIATGDPYRDIAGRYRLTRSALLRHKADHVTADILAAWQRERADNGAELAGELRGWMDRLTMLFDACHDWLLDPDDPTRYDLGPRAHEVMVHYEAPIEGPVRPQMVDALVEAARALVAERQADRSGRLEWMGVVSAVRRLNEHDGIGDEEGDGDGSEEENGPSVIIRTGPRYVRRKARLADLLARVDGHELVGGVTLVEHKSADPRELILKANKELAGNLRLLGELVGRLATQGTVNFIASPEWVALRTRMLAALALYPDARLALAAAIEGEAEEVPV